MLTPEQLVALAATRGVDLSRFLPANGDAHHDHGPDHHRRGSRAWLDWYEIHGVELPPGSHRADVQERQRRWATATRSDEPPLPLSELAIRWTLCHDVRVYWRLFYALSAAAQRRGWREQWPPTLPGEDGERTFYLPQLVQLVLAEDAYPAIFAAAPTLRAWCTRVTARAWNQHLIEPYSALRALYAAWRDSGLKYVRGQILGERTQCTAG